MPKCFLNTVYQTTRSFGDLDYGKYRRDLEQVSSTSSIPGQSFRSNSSSYVPQWPDKQRDIIHFKSMNYLPVSTRYQMIRQGTSVDVTGDPVDTSVHIEESPFVYDKSRWSVEVACNPPTSCGYPDGFHSHVSPCPSSGSPPEGYHKHVLTSMLTAGSLVTLPGRPLDPQPPSLTRRLPTQAVDNMKTHGSPGFVEQTICGSDSYEEAEPKNDTFIELQPVRMDEYWDTTNQPLYTKTDHSQPAFIVSSDNPQITCNMLYMPAKDGGQPKHPVMVEPTTSADKLHKLNQQVEAHTKEKTAIEALVAMSTTTPVGELMKQDPDYTTPLTMSLSKPGAMSIAHKTDKCLTEANFDEPLLISDNNGKCSQTTNLAAHFLRQGGTSQGTSVLLCQPPPDSTSSSAPVAKVPSDTDAQEQTTDVSHLDTSKKEFERFKTESHALAVDSNGNQIHQCTICERVFTIISAFAAHVATHFKHKNKCTVCSKQFSRSWLLKGHMRTHTGERPYMCKHLGCDKAFADKSNLRSHMLIHRATNKNFTCPKCQRAFAQKRYLHKHKLEVCKI